MIRIENLKDEVKRLLDISIPVLLVGETGIGKTSSIMSLHQRIHIIRGSYVTPEMLMIIGVDGKVIINPDIISSEIIFVDEINQAPGVVQNYLTAIIDYAIMNGKKIVAAANIGGGYETFEFPTNVLCRFAILNIAGDTTYLRKNYEGFGALIKALEPDLNLVGGTLFHTVNSPRQVEYFLKYSLAYGLQEAISRAVYFFTPQLASKLGAIRFDLLFQAPENTGVLKELNLLEVSILSSILAPEQLFKVAQGLINLGKFELAEIIIGKLDEKLASRLKALMQAKLKK